MPQPISKIKLKLKTKPKIESPAETEADSDLRPIMMNWSVSHYSKMARDFGKSIGKVQPKCGIMKNVNWI